MFSETKLDAAFKRFGAQLMKASRDGRSAPEGAVHVNVVADGSRDASCVETTVIFTGEGAEASRRALHGFVAHAMNAYEKQNNAGGAKQISFSGRLDKMEALTMRLNAAAQMVELNPQALQELMHSATVIDNATVSRTTPSVTMSDDGTMTLSAKLQTKDDSIAVATKDKPGTKSFAMTKHEQWRDNDHRAQMGGTHIHFEGADGLKALVAVADVAREKTVNAPPRGRLVQ